MGTFGWSYPAGCSGPPDDERPCEICQAPEEDCECPACPVCGEKGNLECYDVEGHGMELSETQNRNAD